MEALRPSFPSSIFDRADHWFVRAKAALSGNVPCGRGCCHCCIGPFPITVLDAEELRRGLQALPTVERQDIQERARRQTAAIESAYPDLAADPILDGRPDWKIDELVARFADQPCPALKENGSCALYSFRPITCRTMGIPTETRGMIHGACEIQISVPIIRLSRPLRIEEDHLADQEAGLIEMEKSRRSFTGDELLLPYGFFPASG